MTTRNLDALFHPNAIALVGASDQAGSVGRVIAGNLLGTGFTGPIFPVNPHGGSIRSSPVYRSVGDLPQAVDLAVIATPAPTVPALIAELGARGCRAAVVISAGVTGPLRQRMLEAARPHLLRIVGPNCLGVISPRVGINASFAHLTPAPGGLALVSQSGAIAAAALDWAEPRGIGFSHVITIGDAADVDMGDLLDYLALDPETKAILLYLESLTDARKFMTAGRIAARSKPVVVIKAGRTSAGAAAAFSHTGALAGADTIYDAAFRRAGMLRVFELRELFDAVTTLSAGFRAEGDRLAILTNGGGAGVMAADCLSERGGRLAQLRPETLAAIAGAAPASWSARNPVDILGDAKPDLYAKALAALLADGDNDAVLVLNCPVAVADSGEAAVAVLRTVKAGPSGRPVLTCWLGDKAATPGRRMLAGAGIPSHETPDEAVRAFMYLVDHKRHQQLLLQTPARRPAEARDPAAARGIIAAARAQGRTVLTDPEARAVLRGFGVTVVEDRVAPSPEAAGRAADELGGPVALKILSPDISHKSDVGGVALNLIGSRAVQAEAAAMLQRVGKARPGASVDGFVVQPMVDRPQAQELLCGIAQDAVFGPVVLFGQGGVATEVLADRCVGLPPLNDVLARDMVARTRVARLLAGFRDRPPADLAAVVDVLLALSDIAGELPEIAELDINPLLAGSEGALALDARIRLRPVGEAAPRAAILPYPRDLERRVALAGGDITIRPIRPQDAARLVDLVEQSTADETRLRLGPGLRQLPAELATRLSQIDYDREMALVAEDGEDRIGGVARLAGDPEGRTAEFALMVPGDRQGTGLDTLLLRALLDHAEAHGYRTVWGEVARRDARMLALTDELGFTRIDAGEITGVRVQKTLNSTARR